MKYFLKEYFSFPSRDRNGIIILLVIVLILIIVPNFLFLFRKEMSTDFSEFEKEISVFQNSRNILKKDSFQLFYFDPNTIPIEQWGLLGLNGKQISTIQNYIKKGGKFSKKEDLKKIYGISSYQYNVLEPYIVIRQNKITQKEKQVIKEFYFDPNTISADQLVLLGLNDRLIKTFINYRNKGGMFYKKEDLKKIYGFSMSLFNRLEPYILIEDKLAHNISEDEFIIELNSATIEDLQRIKGIGPVYSKRIIRYRDLLGGYVRLEQLHEVYGFSEELFNEVKDFLRIDIEKIRKINLNLDNLDVLSKHPYLTKYQADAILNYRKFKDKISHIEEVIENNLLSEEEYLKIKPYFEVR